ncbi:MAG: 50S ribosomal protein L31e, partial [Candidatus Geothermarchaeales archaeon]
MSSDEPIEEVEEEGKGEPAREVEEKEEEERREIEEFKPVEERVYVIPLHKARVGRGYRRTKKAIKYLREFIVKHMKSEDVVIMGEVNEKIWEHGIRDPPRRIRVKALKN